MKRMILAASVAMIGSSAFAQVSCGDTAPALYVPSWGSTAIQSVESMSHPNGAFHGYSYFFWHNDERLRYFQSKGTSDRNAFGRIVLGGFPNYDATFELVTSFKNSLPGVFYSNDPAGPWETNMTYPFIRHEGLGDASPRQVSVGTFQAATIEVGKLYWFQYPMVGSSTAWYLPTRSPIRIDAVVGKRWPANANFFDKDDIRTCAGTTVLPEGWVTAPVECAKWSYDYFLDPALPSGVLGGPMAHNPDLVEKRIPGMSRFGGSNRRPRATPRGDIFIDIFQRPGQMTSGASFAYC